MKAMTPNKFLHGAVVPILIASGLDSAGKSIALTGVSTSASVVDSTGAVSTDSTVTMNADGVSGSLTVGQTDGDFSVKFASTYQDGDAVLVNDLPFTSMDDEAASATASFGAPVNPA